MKHCVFCLVHMSLPLFSFSSAFLSACVEKEEESKVHCQCKGSDVARQQSYSLWIRSMQVPPGSRRDLDLDCSPNVVALDRDGLFWGMRQCCLPCERNPQIYWKSSFIFGKRKIKIKSGDNKHHMIHCWEWTFSGEEVFFTASLQITHLHRAASSTLVTPSALHPTSYQSKRAIERNIKSLVSLLSYPHSDLLPCSRFKTGNGPSRQAKRRGWWGSLGIPYCCPWRGLRWGRLPWLSEPVPHHLPPPAPPDCPCWSPGCWGEGCGLAERRWRTVTGGGRRG